jgi:hypothetical protein
MFMNIHSIALNLVNSNTAHIAYPMESSAMDDFSVEETAHQELWEKVEALGEEIDILTGRMSVNPSPELIELWNKKVDEMSSLVNSYHGQE